MSSYGTDLQLEGCFTLAIVVQVYLKDFANLCLKLHFLTLILMLVFLQLVLFSKSLNQFSNSKALKVFRYLILF